MGGASSMRRGVAARPASLWSATAPPGCDFDRLNDAIETDILVIGGGVAGLTTALRLAEIGVETVLLDADQPGSGATGQSGGLIAPDYIRHNPQSIGAVLGRSEGERLTKLLGGSAQACFELIRRLGIDCDARQDGFWSPAHTAALAESQRLQATQWRSRGYNVAFVDERETRSRLGSHRYCGALRFEDGGSLNPLAYARGLARAAQQAGAQIFTRSAVNDLSQAGARWRAVTQSGGSVKARRVVLAANGGNAALHPAMRRTVLPLHVVEFATAPLPPAQRSTVLGSGGSFTDKTPYVFTARYDGAGRIISAFPASHIVRGEAASRREARRRLAGHFVTTMPAIEYIWQGVAWLNSSLLPEVYDLGEGAFAIQACNGRGLAINTVIGAEMAEFLAKSDTGLLSVKPRRPVPIRMHWAASLLPAALMSMAYLSNRAFSVARAA